MKDVVIVITELSEGGGVTELTVVNSFQERQAVIETIHDMVTMVDLIPDCKLLDLASPQSFRRLN